MVPLELLWSCQSDSQFWGVHDPRLLSSHLEPWSLSLLLLSFCPVVEADTSTVSADKAKAELKRIARRCFVDLMRWSVGRRIRLSLLSMS